MRCLVGPPFGVVHHGQNFRPWPIAGLYPSCWRSCRPSSTVPSFCSRVQIFQLVRGSRVRVCFQHRVFSNEEEDIVRDWVITRATLGFILGGLECVDVLEDAFAILVVFLHSF